MKSKITFNKREKEKQRQTEQLRKKEKMQHRRANQVKGKSLEQMMAWLDEYGNITSTPPDPRRKLVINANEIPMGMSRHVEQKLLEGHIDYFNESKGFGFIINKQGEKFFFHVSQFTEVVRENDKVRFEAQRGPKGWTAVGVKKIQ